jgi:hypothetical protein
MAGKALERESEVAVEKNSRERRPLGRDAESLIVYRPKNTSVELEVESYSAMRYHGQ